MFDCGFRGRPLVGQPHHGFEPIPMHKISSRSRIRSPKSTEYPPKLDFSDFFKKSPKIRSGTTPGRRTSRGTGIRGQVLRKTDKKCIIYDRFLIGSDRIGFGGVGGCNGSYSIGEGPSFWVDDDDADGTVRRPCRFGGVLGRKSSQH